MILFGYGIIALDSSVIEVGWLHGLKVVAVAVVAQAIWGMAKALCPDKPRGTVAVLAAILALFLSGVPGQMAAIIFGAIVGLFFLRYEQPIDHESHLFAHSKKNAVISLSLFFGLLLILPVLAVGHSQTLALIDSFYRSGSLVFGGGHVVLPLLQAEVVNSGWISKDVFLAGYGAAQAVPGPLFTFSAYLGSALNVMPNGWVGGVICLFAIFAPSFLLVIGILPFWEGLRRNLRVRQALTGVNAAVVGLLLAAFYDPVWSNGVLSVGDFLLALAAFSFLTLWKIPLWIVVGMAGLGGAFISLF
jgi:chromate transporter